ncbi:MAG: hypothetical protein HY738_21395 [Bacteroidia bacterium]|nr:hypothetical protein [Bacteroidia bacterium]
MFRTILKIMLSCSYLSSFCQDTIMKPAMDKNKLNLSLTMPYVNSYSLRIEGKQENSIGFLGIAGAFDYGNHNKFYTIKYGVACDFPIPVPAAYDPPPDGNYKKTYSSFLNITLNKKFPINLNKIHFWYGSGLSYNKITWSYVGTRDTILYICDFKRVIKNSLGITSNIYYGLTKRIYVGLIYSPNFILFDDSFKFEYNHFVTVELLWRLKDLFQ